MFLICIISMAAFLIDSHERIIDYTIFTFPKTIEGLWDLLIKLNILKNYPNGERYLFAFLIGFTVVIKEYYNEKIPKNYRNLIQIFYGIEN